MSYSTLYKAIIRPHLNFADVIYDKPNKKTWIFVIKIESLGYNVILLLELSAGHKRKNFTKNWALHLQVQEDG